MADLLLAAAEARVVASLVEKSITTPQYYPMTVNAITAAANQKTSRNPVMALSEGDTAAALHRLEELKLVSRDEHSGRALKWRHRFNHQMLLQGPPLAVLVTLMLRGPQTVAELRSNAANLGGPADAESAQKAIEDLSDRAQPLVMMLPRAPGQKEARYAHTLCGTPATPEPAQIETAAPARETARLELGWLEQRIAALEERVAELERRSVTSGSVAQTDVDAPGA
jgi:uncharacterized protein YceH (UPF0502 family)